jgi:hypothetical protein
MSTPMSPLEAADDYVYDSARVIPFTTTERERLIPIRVGDLVRQILSDPALTPAERFSLERFSQILYAVIDHRFLSWYRGLKDRYAPLDPDNECVALSEGTAPLRQQSDELFLGPFESTLLRANFKPLESDEVRKAIEAPNERGVNYVPDFEIFEHLKVYVRGRTRVKRHVRSPRTLFRRRTVELEAFKRMIVAFKFKPSRKLDAFAATNVVYLRLFKDVPFVDMEMHLPEQGTRVRMRGIDKAQIASPVFVGLPTFALKLLKITLLSPTALGGLLLAPISIGVNSFFGFQRAKQRHLHHMIRNLYYLTLSNNAGVINWVIDAAVEEEFKEAFLAYVTLWHNQRDGQAWTDREIDRKVEAYLKGLTNLTLDFDIRDALDKLVTLGLVEKEADRGFHALPLDGALARLDEQWDNAYRFRAERQAGVSLASPDD